MKYDERTAAYATYQVLASHAGDRSLSAAAIGRSLGTNAQGVYSMIPRFVGVDPWKLRPLWVKESIQLMAAALAIYRCREGLPPDAVIDPGRPLVPPLPPKPKVIKQPPPPDTSEYGLAKMEYLAALERLKAAKAKAKANV